MSSFVDGDLDSITFTMFLTVRSMKYFTPSGLSMHILVCVEAKSGQRS